MCSWTIEVCSWRAVGIPARVCEGAGHSGHSMSGLSTLGCTFRSRYVEIWARRAVGCSDSLRVKSESDSDGG